ncbi:hypothetical protein QE152_g32202 [Popillia japonica]|uniref:Uncharacterized protein n=1 Tax=Popillia japonica TaxID=7064 RepID=A0AAW1J095_POPJA
MGGVDRHDWLVYRFGYNKLMACFQSSKPNGMSLLEFLRSVAVPYMKITQKPKPNGMSLLEFLRSVAVPYMKITQKPSVDRPRTFSTKVFLDNCLRWLQTKQECEGHDTNVLQFPIRIKHSPAPIKTTILRRNARKQSILMRVYLEWKKFLKNHSNTSNK